MGKKGMRGRREGLTLIEMLVVTVIISVLAGMILSVSISAVRSARRTRCLSNLRQYGLGAARPAECSEGGCESGRPPGWTKERAERRYGTDIVAFKYTGDGYLLIVCEDRSVRAIREKRPEEE